VKNILFSILVLSIYGCSSYPIEQEVQNSEVVQQCLGSTNLPESIATHFESIEDKALLNEALGNPNKGKLCHGQVYKSKKGSTVTLFRAWNSTNPNSKFGKWWALLKPAGKISTYRAEYEICYQWSPLDKLVSCELKPNIKVVVGTGQSAECSEYLTYPVSDKQQIYIEDAASALINCTLFDGEFSWKQTQ
jgi:hypothetical protein